MSGLCSQIGTRIFGSWKYCFYRTHNQEGYYSSVHSIYTLSSLSIYVGLSLYGLESQSIDRKSFKTFNLPRLVSFQFYYQNMRGPCSHNRSPVSHSQQSRSTGHRNSSSSFVLIRVWSSIQSANIYIHSPIPFAFLLAPLTAPMLSPDNNLSRSPYPPLNRNSLSH